ncbi:unnamed protein product, partial [Dibothriocephalus latus]
MCLFTFLGDFYRNLNFCPTLCAFGDRDTLLRLIRANQFHLLIFHTLSYYSYGGDDDEHIAQQHGNVPKKRILVGLVMGVRVDQNTDVFVKDRFYTGCRILQPLSKWTGLSVDVANFLFSALVASLLGLFMRFLLPPKRYSYRLRASLEVAFGLLLVTFCFGHQVRVLILQSLVTYLLLRFCRLDVIRTP